jgi:hypothetical protein
MTRRSASTSQTSDLVEWARANELLAHVLLPEELVDVAQRAQYRASVGARTPRSQPRHLGYLPVSMDVLCAEMRKAVLDHLTVHARPEAFRIGAQVGRKYRLSGVDLEELRENVADGARIRRIIEIFDPSRSDYESHVGSRLTLRAKTLAKKYRRRQEIWQTSVIPKLLTPESEPDFSLQVEARIFAERAVELIGPDNVKWLTSYYTDQTPKTPADRKAAERLRKQLRISHTAD